MPLPTPRKGTAEATGKVKPSRRDALLAATRDLAAEQLPEEHTLTAIEGERPPAADAAPDPEPPRRPPHAPASRNGAGETAARGAPESLRRTAATDDTTTVTGRGRGGQADATLTVRPRAVRDIRPSPFQPKGRPSAAAVAAVRTAIAEAGSLAALVGPDGTRVFARLDAEAARLAELAADVAEHGVTTPVELRAAEDGSPECLAGHRRLAAAALAGLERVPALDLGPMSNAAAAATVLRGNLHRENFTTWQEAVLVAEVQERRRADGHQDHVRALAAVMGWSHGKVNMLLRIRRALPSSFLARLGGGDPALAEEPLSRAAYRDLERLAGEPDDERRLAAARRLLGLGGGPAPAKPAPAAYVHQPRRTGGFLLDVRLPPERMSAEDALPLRDILEAELTRLRERIDSFAQTRRSGAR